MLHSRIDLTSFYNPVSFVLSKRIFIHIEYLKKALDTKMNLFRLDYWPLFVNWENPNYYLKIKENLEKVYPIYVKIYKDIENYSQEPLLQLFEKVLIDFLKYLLNLF